jgi:hypothetical protein
MPEAYKFVALAPAWLEGPPSAQAVSEHERYGGRWLCSPPSGSSPQFFDLRVSAGRVTIAGKGTALADVLADGDNRRMARARWARATVDGVALAERKREDEAQPQA